MVINPKEHKYHDIYKLMIGSIVPRPIAFVSTVSRDGIFNLAPFSFFNGVCSNPPTILFTISVPNDHEKKDTLVNIETTKEFVVNIVSEEFANELNACSADYPPEVDEFAISGLTPIPSDLIKPPRVKESKISMECKLIQIVQINPQQPGGGNIVIGEVLRFHVNDELTSNFRIDADKLNAIGRMGGPTYCRTKDRFDIDRPKLDKLKK
jgi:flavin reductase (DIM6/NTAB) family NADH-FMN oxidoreductase RutF